MSWEWGTLAFLGTPLPWDVVTSILWDQGTSTPWDHSSPPHPWDTPQGPDPSLRFEVSLYRGSRVVLPPKKAPHPHIPGGLLRTSYRGQRPLAGGGVVSPVERASSSRASRGSGGHLEGRTPPRGREGAGTELG